MKCTKENAYVLRRGCDDARLDCALLGLVESDGALAFICVKMSPSARREPGACGASIAFVSMMALACPPRGGTAFACDRRAHARESGGGCE